MSRQDIVILGGGLSGLAAALESGGTIYEAADHFGGVANSDKTAGFSFDRGIHVLQTQNQNILDLCKELGVEFHIVNRSAHIFAHNRYTAYPFQINSTGLPLRKRLNCVWSYLQRDKNPKPTNYQEWMYKTIGTGFADTFLIPYSEKFWGVHPREMTFEWTGNRVPKSNVWQVLRGAVISKNTRVGTNATFRYPKGKQGYGEIAAAIRARLDDRVKLNHRAIHIDPEQRRVDFENGESVNYKILVSTIPLPELAGIVKEVPAHVQSAIDGLRTNSIMVVNFGVNRPNISEKHWVHFPESDFSFFRLSFPHNFSPDMAPAGTSSVSCEVSVDPDNLPDTEQLIERVKADLVKCRVLRKDDEVIASTTYFIRYGYCIFDQHRQNALPVIKKWLSDIGIMPCGRYGLWTYFWSDEAILSGLKCGTKASKALLAAEDAGKALNSVTGRKAVA